MKFDKYDREITLQCSTCGGTQFKTGNDIQDKLKLRCGGKRAIVGIARRLVGRMRARLRGEKTYKLAAVAA